MKVQILCLSILLGVANWSCNKDDIDAIPLVAVDLTLFLNDPEYINLSTVTGWEYIQGGSMGIIVYRSSIDEFVAFERHSPVDPQNACAVIVDSASFLIADPCSDATFLLLDGSVVSGSNAQPLKQYQTYFDGFDVLRIFN
ncbi:MAG: hypothetical protein MRY83_22935 [Flavobacteriales bacterium]|nr:hypothetical protein [Flavobacteriales bacterium]